VEIQTSTKKGILSVPIQAVTVREDSAGVSQECVFIPENSRVALRYVKTGIQDGSYIEVTEGLTTGEQVVSGPYAALSKTLMDNMLIHEQDQEEDVSEDQ
jgi:HlyD family secretion protein